MILKKEGQCLNKKMKKENRQIYLILAEEVSTALCSFCRYHEGSSICEEEYYGYCEHPIETVKKDRDLTPGDDCWGFSSLVPVSDAADIVGVILANGWTRWVWWFEKDWDKKLREIHIWGNSGSQ